MGRLSPRPLAGRVLGTTLFGMACLTALWLLAPRGIPAWDRALLDLFAQIRSPLLDRAMGSLTWLGSLWLLLPASQAAASEPEADRGAAPARGQRGTRLLVMDDEEIIRSLTAEMLGELGYQVQTCINGEQAVEMYRKAQQEGAPFGAVIMDLTVPGGMGGKEAAVEILKLDPAARLIVSSGYSNDPVMANYTSYGFSAMIVKPYHLADMAQTLSRLLEVTLER